jgi:NADPH:quinone reductase-like Zn-dependent oxidoreductase
MPRFLLLLVLLLPAACAMPGLREADRSAIAGRTWVVTGASSGIGRGVAERAGQMGANVVLAARRAEALEEVARVIRANGGEALVVPTDVSRPEQMEALAEAASAASAASMSGSTMPASRRSGGSRRSRSRTMRAPST